MGCPAPGSGAAGHAMKLAAPGMTWNRLSEARRNQEIENANRENHKRGRDVEVGRGRVILTSPGGVRYALSVDDAGALTTSLVTTDAIL